LTRSSVETAKWFGKQFAFGLWINGCEVELSILSRLDP
jgi:hypothetical protein